MDRQKLLNTIEEIQNRNYKEFKGSNEAELMIREEIADLFIQGKYLPLDFVKWYSGMEEEKILPAYKRYQNVEGVNNKTLICAKCNGTG